MLVIPSYLPERDEQQEHNKIASNRTTNNSCMDFIDYFLIQYNNIVERSLLATSASLGTTESV